MEDDNDEALQREETQVRDESTGKEPSEMRIQ